MLLDYLLIDGVLLFRYRCRVVKTRTLHMYMYIDYTHGVKEMDFLCGCARARARAPCA